MARGQLYQQQSQPAVREIDGFCPLVDQLIAFMEPNNVPGIPSDYDAGINKGLGVPGAFYHFAFEAGSVAALEAKREELLDKGQTVTDIVDHEWAKSIYLKDPNGISLEFCCLTRDVGTQDDVTMQLHPQRLPPGRRWGWSCVPGGVSGNPG